MSDHQHSHSPSLRRSISVPGLLGLLLFIAAFAVLIATVSLHAATVTGGVVPIGAAGGITTDLTLRNVGSVDVTQFLGSRSTPQPNGSVAVVTTTATLHPGETHMYRRVDLNFDTGLWVLQIDNRLESSVYVDYHNGVTKFECGAIVGQLTTSGTWLEFHRVVVDDSTATGTWVQTLNLGLNPVGVTAVVQGPARDPVSGFYLETAEFFTAAPGITQYRIRTQIPVGGAVKMYDGQPGASAGSTPPLTWFLVTGPADGGTQAVRYPEAPGS